MRKQHKLIPVLLLFLLLIVALGGCTKKNDNSGKDSPVFMSRAKYIGMLGEAFGYEDYVSDSPIFKDVAQNNENFKEIQAAAEWEIIDSSKDFKPDDAASLGFAIESAVKAIGVDRIKRSGASIDENDLVGFFVNNIAKIDVDEIDNQVDAEVAELILSYAEGYNHNMTTPQVMDIDFTDDVKFADTRIVLNADGKTGAILEEGAYKVGDIVYFGATDTSLARGIVITAIEGKTFTFKDAEIDQVFSNISVHGTFEGKVIQVTPASDSSTPGLGREIYDEMKAYKMSSTGDYLLVPTSNSAWVDGGGDHFVFNARFDVSASENVVSAEAQGSLTVGIKNITPSVDYEHEGGWLGIFKPKMVGFNLHFDTEVSSSIHGNVGATIPLGEATIQVGGPLSPINIMIKLTAHVGADGNIEVSYTTSNDMGISWRKGTGLQQNFDSTANASCHIDARVTAEATLLADLRIGYWKLNKSIANAQVSGGLVGVATVDADLMGGLPTCTDIKVYVSLKWGVNQQSCVLTDISGSLKANGDIWNSENSPVRLHYHIEDGVLVDECTRTDPVEQELVTPEGEPLIEQDPFDFEPLEFDFIELERYSMYLDKGQSMDIGFISIPGGAGAGDLVYEVEDGAVCSVSNGTVHALESGSTIVKIKTRDGMYSVAFVVTVRFDYSVPEFEEL